MAVALGNFATKVLRCKKNLPTQKFNHEIGQWCGGLVANTKSSICVPNKDSVDHRGLEKEEEEKRGMRTATDCQCD